MGLTDRLKVMDTLAKNLFYHFCIQMGQRGWNGCCIAAGFVGPEIN